MTEQIVFKVREKTRTAAISALAEFIKSQYGKSATFTPARWRWSSRDVLMAITEVTHD